MIDRNADTYRAGFVDNVEGYSNQEIYDALDDDVESMPEFRDRLLQENNDRDRNDHTTGHFPF